MTSSGFVFEEQHGCHEQKKKKYHQRRTIRGKFKKASYCLQKNRQIITFNHIMRKWVYENSWQLGSLNVLETTATEQEDNVI